MDLWNCPKCGGKTATYRHPYARVWCTICGHVLRTEGDHTILHESAKSDEQDQSEVTKETEMWDSMRKELNELHERLKGKPDGEKMGYAGCPGGVLNAYREADITFEQAVKAIEEWAVSQPSTIWQTTEPPKDRPILRWHIKEKKPVVVWNRREEVWCFYITFREQIYMTEDMFAPEWAELPGAPPSMKGN